MTPVRSMDDRERSAFRAGKTQGHDAGYAAGLAAGVAQERERVRREVSKWYALRTQSGCKEDGETEMERINYWVRDAYGAVLTLLDAPDKPAGPAPCHICEECQHYLEHVKNNDPEIYCPYLKDSAFSDMEACEDFKPADSPDSGEGD